MFLADRLGRRATQNLTSEVPFGAMKTFWDSTKLAFNTVNVTNAAGLSIKVVNFK